MSTKSGELPQKINRFELTYAYLSNFYVEPDGTHVEGEYHAAKLPTLELREMYSRMLMEVTPSQAKKIGRTVKLREDWDAVKVDTMRELVARKFKDHPGLAERLKGTGDAVLEEGNYWGDTFWGICGGEGENWMGKILMEVRATL